MVAADFNTDPLAFSAAAHPGRTAVVDLTSGQRLNFGALADLADRAAAWLEASGVTAGERVAFLGRNGLELLVLALGAERHGAVFVPLNWRLAGPEIAALLTDCTPRLVVAQPEFAHHVLGAQDSGTVLDAIKGHGPRRPVVLDADRPIILLYTSGTTGAPKAAVITARNALASALNFSAVGDVGAGAVTFSDLPMFHTIGLIAVARTTLLVGGTLVLADRFLPARTLATLGDSALGVTHYFAVPVMAETLARDPGFDPAHFSRLHAVFLGGAPLSPALIERFLAFGVPLVNGYGMSETGTALHVPVDRDAVRHSAGAVGLAAPHIEVRLVSEGRDVADGEVGEIWLRGPSVTPGYWNRPAETAATFSDGWFRSGDLARRERGGFYRIVDRLKDMYVTGGENVYPAEVEAVLARHPDVTDAAVLGVADPRWGETGVALVAIRAGTPFDTAALGAHCAAHLARYKCPSRIVAVPAVPRSAAGKILKPLLREQLNRGEL